MYILIVPARPEDFMMEIDLLLNPTKTARCHPLNLPFNRGGRGSRRWLNREAVWKLIFRPSHPSARFIKMLHDRNIIVTEFRVGILLTMTCGGIPSRPKFQVNQYTVGGLGGHTGFCLRFLADRFELEHFHNWRPRPGPLPAVQISSRTETRSMPEPEVKNIFCCDSFLGKKLPSVRGKRFGGITRHRFSPKLLAPVCVPHIEA